MVPENFRGPSSMQPYITFVVAARNDNYGGDFLYRMQLCVSTLGALANRHRLKAELLVVEWNPPPDRPRLRDVIDWPRDSGLGVRIVTVPEEVHRGLPNSDKMPMFEYMAKNVGIRRATGQYVLSTNPDILLPGEIISYFARRCLSPDSFYRVDRYDVSKRVPAGLPVEERLSFCARHVFRVCWTHGTIPTRSLARFKLYLRTNLPRLLPHRLVPGLLRRGMRLIRFLTSAPISHQKPMPPVHTNACGDFMLMSCERWHALRAYPELRTFSHIDSYMGFIAAIAGLKQIVLPFPIFHQEHDRSDQATRPLTVLEEIPAFRHMRETGELVITNDGSWGLGNVELPTAVVG